MKDIRNLTDKEREEVFRLLKPLGWKEGDDLHICEIYSTVDGEKLKEVKDGSN